MNSVQSDSNSDSEDVPKDVPPEKLAAAKEIALNSLPNISKQKYTIVYNEFKKWRSTKNTKSFAESVLLVYFDEIATKYAPSTLWSRYPMLKATIKAYDNIDISTYPQLLGFLKKKSSGYQPKKSSAFTTADVSKFLKEAPDANFLVMKAILVIGLSGACRREELANLCMEDIQDYGSFLFVTLKIIKTEIVRTFTVVGEFHKIAKKYMEQRPRNSKTDRFCLTYRAGKCVLQPLGINKIGGAPQEIAKYLELENPQLYTGHTFRRSSATILVDAGADITVLKRHGGWKSNTVTEGYIQDSITNKKAIGYRIEGAIPSTSNSSKRLKLNENMIDASVTENEATQSFDNTLYPNPSENNSVSTHIPTVTVIPETPEMSCENSRNILDVEENKKNQEPIKNKNISVAINELKSLQDMSFNFVNCQVTININQNLK